MSSSLTMSPDRDPAVGLGDAEDLPEELTLVLGAHEVQDAVRQHDVDRLVGDHRFAAQLVFGLTQFQPALEAIDWATFQPLVEFGQVEREILDHPAVEGDVVVADLLGDLRVVLGGQRQHLGVHVDAEDSPRLADDLARDPADLAGAAA